MKGQVLQRVPGGPRHQLSGGAACLGQRLVTSFAPREALRQVPMLLATSVKLNHSLLVLLPWRVKKKMAPSTTLPLLAAVGHYQR